jgi:acyl-CoA synthetase (AMP-forming)/AMP-acid ligase II
VIASLPLDRPLGIHHGLLLAAVLGRPLGLIERFHHHAVLALFASGEYHYWAATPAMVDILGRCPLAGPHAAPPRCMINGRLSSAIARAFEARFGVRPRPVYGLTEQGPVALDDGPDSAVRPDTAGRPLPGIGLRVGDDPRAPLPPGQVGRVWISNPWRMEGYGYPPSLERPESVDGWWASPDLGWLDEAGYLTLAGRTDDCLRMGTGHLVNPATVAACAESHPGVREAAVVALDTAGERVLAVLVESVETLRRTDLRAHLACSLPAWCQPRIVETVPALPRLSTGRADRRACVEILRKAQAREGP